MFVLTKHCVNLLAKIFCAYIRTKINFFIDIFFICTFCVTTGRFFLINHDHSNEKKKLVQAFIVELGHLLPAFSQQFLFFVAVWELASRDLDV